MRLISKIFPYLVMLFLVGGCSDADQPPAPAPAPKKAPQFKQAEDPKVFFANYLEDLATYIPPELHEELTGRTKLSEAVEMIRRYHAMSFLEWYYSDAYLAKVQEIVDQKIKRMDYQLKILDVAAADAADVLLLTDAGLLEQKTALQDGEVTQQWDKIDAQAYRLTLSGGDWSQPLSLTRENGAWKLAVANF